MLYAAILLGTILATGSVASPTPSSAHTFTKRWEEGVDCTSDRTNYTPNFLIAIDSEGNSLPCDDGLNGLTSTNGVTCYQRQGEGTIGRIVKCPGDPAPETNPDGSDNPSAADTFMSVYCSQPPSIPSGLTDFVSFTACLLYGYFEAHGDVVAENEAGAVALCDFFLVGACTFFSTVEPALLANTPCVNQEGYDLCDLASS